MGAFSDKIKKQTTNSPKGAFSSYVSRSAPSSNLSQPHSSVDQRGFSSGFSPERDTSGRNYYAYRNPGDTSTTTDYTRVATQFNPRTPAPQPRDSFYNPRDPKIGNNNPNDQIDHKTALALSGSNHPANLRTVPNAMNGDGTMVSNFQRAVMGGKSSLAQAQTDLAIEKKLPLPVTGSRYGEYKQEAIKAEEDAKKQNSKWGLFKNTVLGLPKAAFNVGKDIVQSIPRAAATVGMELQKPLQKFGVKNEDLPFKLNQEGKFQPEGIQKIAFGKEAVSNISQKRDEGSEFLQKFGVNKKASGPLALTGAIALTALDLTPFGAGKGKLLKQLAKETSEEGVKRLLKNRVSDEIAKRIAKTKSIKEIEGLLKQPKIHPDDLGEMRDFTDYVNGAYKPKDSVQLEIDARRIAERHGINPDQGNKALSTQFGKILDEKMSIPKKVAPTSNTSSRIIDSSVPPKKGMFRTAVDNLKTSKGRQGGFAKNPFSRAEYDDGYFKRNKNESPEISQKRTELEITKEALANHPAKGLAKYANKNGELPEVLGGKGGLFRKTGDDISSQLGFEDAETARRSYQDYRLGQQKVAKLEGAFKSQKQLAKENVAKMFAERDRKIASQYVDKKVAQRKPPTLAPKKEVPQFEKSPGEVRSIEKMAEQATGKLDEGLVPYKESIPKTQTPVTKKVNILDTFVRTPDRVMKKIGFEDEAKMLRTAKNTIDKELPLNLDRITAWSKEVPKESNTRIFKWLDGDAIDLRPEEMKVANEVKAWLKEWAERLKLPKDQRISHYITRLWDKELLGKEFDEDLAKIIADKIPGSVYDPFLLRRLGAKGYKQDTWAALEAYVKRGTRKVHMDIPLQKIKEKAGGSLDMANIEKSNYKYVQRYIENVNMRPTDLDEGFDNLIKSIPFVGHKLGPRPVTSVLKMLRQMTFRGMLGLNPGSALRNLSQGINTYATLGEKYTVIGYSKLFSKNNMAELTREGVLNTGFIQDRVLTATKKNIQRLDKGLFIFFDTAEKINRGAAYFGAKSKGLAKGMSEAEAINYAKEIVRKTQFVFDSVDTPVGLSSDVMKTFTQFGTFSLKQAEFLTEMAMDKNYKGFIRYGVAGIAFVLTIGKAFGMEPTELIPFMETIRRGELPFGNPPSLQAPVEVIKAAANAPDDYGNERSFKRKALDVGKSFLGLVPGGTQAKKSYQGYQAVKEGGSYDRGNKLQFKVGETKAQKAQAVVFGKYSSKQAKDHFNDDVDLVRDEAIKIDKELQSLTKSQANKRALEIKKSDPQLYKKLSDVIEERTLGLTKEDQKMRGLGVENGDRAKYVNDLILSLPKEQRAARYKELKKKKIITSGVDKQLKEMNK